MKRKLSTSEKVRRLIDQGYTTQAIVKKLDVKPQVVYNIRYQVNKARGLGAIGAPAPTPTTGIGAPPKRKYTRRVRAGTGIDHTPALPMLTEPIVTMPNGVGVVFKASDGVAEPPSLWQRIKGWFRG